MPPSISYCAARGCSNSSKPGPGSITMVMFKFPAVDDKRGRLKTWVQRAGDSKLLLLPPAKLRQKYLCPAHFEDDQFTNRCHVLLHRFALPTIFLNEPLPDEAMRDFLTSREPAIQPSIIEAIETPDAPDAPDSRTPSVPSTPPLSVPEPDRGTAAKRSIQEVSIHLPDSSDPPESKLARVELVIPESIEPHLPRKWEVEEQKWKLERLLVSVIVVKCCLSSWCRVHRYVPLTVAPAAPLTQTSSDAPSPHVLPGFCTPIRNSGNTKRIATPVAVIPTHRPIKIISVRKQVPIPKPQATCSTSTDPLLAAPPPPALNTLGLITPQATCSKSSGLLLASVEAQNPQGFFTPQKNQAPYTPSHTTPYTPANSLGYVTPQRAAARAKVMANWAGGGTPHNDDIIIHAAKNKMLHSMKNDILRQYLRQNSFKGLDRIAKNGLCDMIYDLLQIK